MIRQRLPQQLCGAALESDIDHIKRAIKILGLENTQYDFFELKNSDSNQIKDRLVVENRIDEFPTFHS